jgi:transposase
MLANAIRAHLSELGIVTTQGMSNLMATVAHAFQSPGMIPELVRWALAPLVASLNELAVRIRDLEARIVSWHRADETSRRLETIPGFGVITASALSASVPDASVFKSGREFAAWLGLTPRQNSSGGKERLGAITKMGNCQLRTLLVNGATSILRLSHKDGAPMAAWMRRLQAKKPPKVVAIALANKMARIAWAVMTKKESYRAVPA